MQKHIVWDPRCLGVYWISILISNLTWKSQLALFWASPCDNSPPVQVRISKFEPKIHINIILGLIGQYNHIFDDKAYFLTKLDRILLLSFLYIFSEMIAGFQATQFTGSVLGELKCRPMDSSFNKAYR